MLFFVTTLLLRYRVELRKAKFGRLLRCITGLALATPWSRPPPLLLDTDGRPL
jgi:hypothetical protein